MTQKEQFDTLVEQVRQDIVNEKDILNQFKIQETKSHWVWISDHKKIIGNGKAHYEIHKNRNNIDVCLHFEGSDKKDFYTSQIYDINKQPNPNIEWFDWSAGYKSLRYSTIFDLRTVTSKEIINALRTLEEELGEKVRKFIKKTPILNKEKRYIIANITWNSKGWKELSEDESNHSYVKDGGLALESWNFDFDNPRNTEKEIFGFVQFTRPPAVTGNNNLVIFYSQDKIVGFYGKCEILKEYEHINNRQSYNLIASRDLSVSLDNYIENVKEQGFLENKERVGQVGFSYLKDKKNINAILEKAQMLNPNKLEQLKELQKWVNYIEDEEPNDIIEKNTNMENIELNQILYGPPGTGKTYNTINEAIKIVDPVFYKNNKNSRDALRERFNKLLIKKKDNDNGQIVFTTFHQSFSYEDFVEGIKPQAPKDECENISYIIKDGIFKWLSNKAKQQNEFTINTEEGNQELTKEIFSDIYDEYVNQLPEQNNPNFEVSLKTPNGYTFNLYRNTKNTIVVRAGKQRHPMSLSKNELTSCLFDNKEPIYKSYYQATIDEIFKNSNTKTKKIKNSSKNYVLIIDEINRGNVSSIFGELITLIEKDKRAGGKEELSVILPYSKKSFSVPSNLYIIGTMNTADRSIEALDTALRRRFSFKEMPPNADIIKKEAVSSNIDGVDLVELLETINLRIEKLIDKDHMIGHSYFLNIKGFEDLRITFKDKIIPLLEEYFYGDYGKINLILGSAFVQKKDNKNEFNFAKDSDAFESDIIDDLKNRTVYFITDYKSWEKEDFIKIYNY